MKNIKLLIYNLILILLVFNLSCYEPISNTSGASDTDKENNDASVSTKKPEAKPTTAQSVKLEDSKSNEMTDSKNSEENRTKFADGFQGNLKQNLTKNGLAISDIYDSSNSVESRILKEYGAVFLTKAMPPNKVIFTSENEVSTFQNKAGSESTKIGVATIQLQAAASKSLNSAIAEAKASGLTISPTDKKSNSDSAKRSYGQTLDLWNSRFYKACEHWKGKGRLTNEQVTKLKSLPIKQQVEEVLQLEKKGIYFNTFFNNSILYSVAAPGTSQHISMLAFDVAEFQNKKVRKILAKHGWFRTVQNDEPHFTYLGHKEENLRKLGLKKVTKKSNVYWIPNI